jgi:hypothetical protein
MKKYRNIKRLAPRGQEVMYMDHAYGSPTDLSTAPPSDIIKYYAADVAVVARDDR